MTAEIGVVFNRPSDHAWLPRLREWIRAQESPLNRLGIRVPVNPLNSPNDALCWRAVMPNERLMVAIGYNSHEIEDCEKFGVLSGEPIIVGDPNEINQNGAASASFLSGVSLVSCRDVIPQIRKSLIRVALRNRIEIRPPRSDKELSGYLSLRYRIYDSVGFLRDENRKAAIRWEIDFWDRSAVPLCAITQDGTIVGCARLIRNQGTEEQPYVSDIQSLLENAGDNKLKELFRFPHIPQHPFDLLMEFSGFRGYFRELIKSGMKPAEIGRVAVHPEHRGQFLSEALVDTAVSFAEARRLSPIFLACREELGRLYAKCGFEPVPGLRSEKFFNIALPSIVMEKRI